MPDNGHRLPDRVGVEDDTLQIELPQVSEAQGEAAMEGGREGGGVRSEQLLLRVHVSVLNGMAGEHVAHRREEIVS